MSIEVAPCPKCYGENFDAILARWLRKTISSLQGTILGEHTWQFRATALGRL